MNPEASIFQIDYAGGDGNDVVVTSDDHSVSQFISDGIKSLSGRGVPGVSYVLEGTADLNPVVQWMQLDTDYAEPNGLFSLYDYPPPTNSMLLLGAVLLRKASLP